VNIKRKPSWLRKKVQQGEQSDMRRLLGELHLNTVCQQAMCPNISECFSCGQATFLILGINCTRQCSFCNVEKKVPSAVDRDEPGRIAEAVVRLKLSHIVITSPTRDDLPDGGAEHFSITVSSIRQASATTRIELLIPDFLDNQQSLKTIVSSHPDIIAHNVETVPRLYHVRSGADYQRSLDVLRRCHKLAPCINTKSGIMLGMGEEESEVEQVFADLRMVNCTYLSIGQYLSPSKQHYPVQEYVQPETFARFRELALQAGFSHVESGPYVRSSYHAGEYK
jgi:lipoic acid synthetase